MKEKDATKQAKDELAATRSKVAQTRKPANLDAQHTKLLTAITEHVKEGGSLADLRPLVQKLAENYVRRGITKLQPLTRALHETQEHPPRYYACPGARSVQRLRRVSPTEQGRNKNSTEGFAGTSAAGRENQGHV